MILIMLQLSRCKQIKTASRFIRNARKELQLYRENEPARKKGTLSEADSRNKRNWLG
jgi:hypothetical protein